MISIEDVKKLAELSRIELDDNEIESYRKDIDSIVSYVGELSKVVEDSESEPLAEVNRMRRDEDEIASDTFKNKLLKEVPDTQNSYIKVKKILKLVNQFTLYFICCKHKIYVYLNILKLKEKHLFRICVFLLLLCLLYRFLSCF
jgi:aspartyl-tRNA(Asn)/glutamyl-tRNA(Gln) amidotransferase subunit C